MLYMYVAVRRDTTSLARKDGNEIQRACGYLCTTQLLNQSWFTKINTALNPDNQFHPLTMLSCENSLP